MRGGRERERNGMARRNTENEEYRIYNYNFNFRVTFWKRSSIAAFANVIKFPEFLFLLLN